MTINYAILGILSFQPMTGYDLKKIMRDSTFMYWSGNNNQIYKALIELLEAGLVTSAVRHQESAPSKKIYTITQKGLEALKASAAAAPEPLEFKNPFLIQLACSDILDNDALRGILEKYENEVRLQLITNREKIRRGGSLAARTGREALLWKLVDENILLYYMNELKWIQNARRQLADFGAAGDGG